MKIFCVLIFLQFTISGCSLPVRPEALRYYSLAEEDYFSEAHQSALFAKERKEGRAHVIGLALAGGGTKAADFGLGVIQGLNEIGLMKNMDVISSVSGGSYTALWYYMRLIDEKKHNGKIDNKSIIINAFNDCSPLRYGNDSTNNLCPQNKTNTEFSNNLIDQYREQNYLRGYQDVFSSGDTAFNYDTTKDKLDLTKDVISLSIKSAGAMLLNVFPNILFDWQLQVSPSRQAYAKGIARTFGAKPPTCTKKGGCDKPSNTKFNDCNEHLYDFCFGYNRRSEGNTTSVENLTFDNLKSPDLPLWIINTTAGEDRTPWDIKKAQPPKLTVFEFTPYGSGSGLYGYKDNLLHKNLSPLDAVIASASFFDSQQKVAFTFPKRNLVAFGMKATTLNWGVSYINPNANKASVVFHHLLPWPLYYFHKFDAGYDSTYIHLSDGGHSENLGVYSLIRRKVPYIIISDHAADRSGTMEDICLLKNNLKEQKLYLNIPGLGGLDEEVCNPEKAGSQNNRKGYDIFNWSYPVLLGCISNGKELNPECAAEKGGGDYFARIFLIKPSISGNKFDEKLINIVEACKIEKSNKKSEKEEIEGNAQNETTACSKIKTFCTNHHTASTDSRFLAVDNDELEFWNSKNPPSCELLNFLMTNSFNEDGINKKDGCPHFPQYATPAMTLNSSPWLYGALKELGRYYAGSFSYFYDSESNTFDLERFNSVLLQQQNHAMQNYILSSKIPGAAQHCAGLGL